MNYHQSVFVGLGGRLLPSRAGGGDFPAIQKLFLNSRLLFIALKRCLMDPVYPWLFSNPRNLQLRDCTPRPTDLELNARLAV